MRILYPVDLVQPIEPTVELLKSYCDLLQHDVRLLYVRELLPAYENLMKSSGKFSDDWEAQIDEKAHAALDETLSRLKPHCKSVTTEVTNGPIASTLCNVARDEKQDLIVVAPARHKLSDLLSLGSTSARVVDHAPCAVLVARAAMSSPGQLKNVVIGFDGSSNAAKAIEQAARLFKLNAAKITVVHSVDVADPIKFLSPVAFVSSIEQDLLMQGEVFLADAKKLLSDLGMRDVECRLVEGKPANEVIKVAKESAADLIVIGARGHAPVQEMLLGSVAHNVAMHAPCSVAVLRAAAP
jgi:nucleotide-binding universal stress UspA family protein